jgi:hypothetical protein
MIVRLVVAMMTVLGAVPLRICTCGYAHIDHHTPALPCSVERDSGPVTANVVSDDSSHGHHHDCAALKPKPAMSLAVPVAIADLPDLAPMAVFVPLLVETTLAPTPTSAEARSPDPPNRPLYLTLCSLRN